MLRTGRLAYRNPAWQPSYARRSAIRNPTELAPDPGHLADVMAAVHIAADAINRIAIEDREAVRAAGHDQRIYAKTLPFPAPNHSQRRYRQADPPRIEEIIASYDTAIEATARATAALDNLALTVDAPTTVLALARRVAPGAGQARHSQREKSHPAHAAIPGPEAGVIQQMLLERQFSDPALLARAAAVDEATRELLAEAAATAHRSDSVAQATSGSPDGSRQRSARLAGSR